jgi:predicted metal-binding protein
VQKADKKKIVAVSATPEKALKDIMARLRQQGASAVKMINISDIVVDERVRLKCQIPICDSYNKNLMCPPHVPSVTTFRKALSGYTGAILIQITAPLTEATVDRPSVDVYAPAKILHELVNMAEKWAFEYNFRFATGLMGGCCRLCDECVAIQHGLFCRYPFKARPSMEAMGIDVVETLKLAGLPISFPIINEVTWTGIVLI